MEICAECPFEKRCDAEFARIKTEESEAAFHKMVTLAICGSILEALAEQIGCDGELSNGDCPFETYVIRHAEESTPDFVQKIDTIGRFSEITNGLDLNI